VAPRIWEVTNIYFGGGDTKARICVFPGKLNKTVTLMDPSLDHILCSEPRDKPQPGSFPPSTREKKRAWNEDGGDVRRCFGIFVGKPQVVQAIVMCIIRECMAIFTQSISNYENVV
jgi:hypothetical protein